MNAIEVLVEQTKEAHVWTNKLIDSVPMKRWEDTPSNLDTNISWQVGHLVISEFYHAILVVTGFDAEITQKINLKSYTEQFGYESNPLQIVGSSNPKELKEHLLFMQHKVIVNIKSLSLLDLNKAVEEPTKRKHPVAKTKFDAISWNIKHTMWHCGQIACIKRLIHGGFDFGLTNRN